jgi:hypothetical protein
MEREPTDLEYRPRILEKDKSYTVSQAPMLLLDLDKLVMLHFQDLVGTVG